MALTACIYMPTVTELFTIQEISAFWLPVHQYIILVRNCLYTSYKYIIYFCRRTVGEQDIVAKLSLIELTFDCTEAILRYANFMDTLFATKLICLIICFDRGQACSASPGICTKYEITAFECFQNFICANRFLRYTQFGLRNTS